MADTQAVLTFSVVAMPENRDRLWTTLNSTLGQPRAETQVIFPARTLPEALRADLSACCRVIESPTQYWQDAYLAGIQQARTRRVVPLDAGDCVRTDYMQAYRHNEFRVEAVITVDEPKDGQFLGAAVRTQAAREALRGGGWRKAPPRTVHTWLCQTLISQGGHHHYPTAVSGERRAISDTVVVSTYWGDRFDPQRCLWWIPRDEEGRIWMWRQGLDHHQCPGVIVHDCLSPEFVARNTSPLLRFIQVPTPPHYVNVNSWRFSAIREHVPDLPHDFIFLTDLFDVRIGCSPAELPDKADKDFWCSVEPTYCGAWQHDLASYGPTPMTGIEHRPLVNAGVFGGRKATLRAVLDSLCNRLQAASYAGRGPAPDMIAFNHTIWRDFRGDRISVGHPKFHSRFTRYDITAPAIFIHK